jgi:Flp pilus assembly protein TadD
MLANAEHETLSSLRLNPGQPDARNLLGVIYARAGKTVRASLVWRELVREAPDYGPARTNLALLAAKGELALGTTAAVAVPPAAVKTIEDERELRSPIRETQLSPGLAQ